MTGILTLEMDPSKITHVLLHRNGELVAKLYFSPDYRKLRIVLPELKNFAQTKIDVERSFLEFTRDPYTAKEDLKK